MESIPQVTKPRMNSVMKIGEFNFFVTLAKIDQAKSPIIGTENHQFHAKKSPITMPSMKSAARKTNGRSKKRMTSGKKVGFLVGKF